MIRFSCESCGKKFAIEGHLAGRQGVCPKCHTRFQVPDSEDSEPARDTTGETGYFPAVEEESDHQAPEEEKRYIRFACEKCDKKFAVAERLGGRGGKCPECGEAFVIPQPDAPVPAARSSRTDATDYLPAVHEEAQEEPPRKKKKKKGKELIRFTCEGCGQKIAVAKRLAGRTGNCPNCSDMFMVPDPEAPEIDVPQVKGNPNETSYYPPVKDEEESEAPKEEAEEPRPAAFQERRRADRRRPPEEPVETASGAKKWIAAAVILLALGGGGAWLGLSAQKPQTVAQKPPATSPTPPSPPPAAKPPEKPPTPPVAPPPKPPVEVVSANPTSTNPPVEKPPVENPPTPPKEDPPTKPPTPPPVENPPTPPKEDPPAKPPTPPPVENPPTPPKEDPPAKPPTPPQEDPPPPKHSKPPTKPPETPPEEPPPDTPAPPPSNQDAKEALEDFEKARENVKGCPDAVQQARALDTLAGALDDERVLVELGKILATKDEADAVRKRAADMLGDSASAKAVQWLARGYRAAQANDGVARAAISALGRVDDAGSVKSLEAIVRAGMGADEPQSTYASYAVTALGQLHRQDSVDAMLRLFGAVRNGEASEDAKRTLEQTLLSALYDCTGQPISTYDDWLKWWDANRKTFK